MLALKVESIFDADNNLKDMIQYYPSIYNPVEAPV